MTYIDVAVDCSMDHRIQDSLAKKANVANAFRREIERVRGTRSLKEALKELLP